MITKLKIIPLGGLGEIGKNMTAIECGSDIIVIDCGMGFPDDDMYGIDIVLPDISYLKSNASKVRGIILTHGHEDHIGAVPYVLKELDVPIYTTPLTAALVELKLEEHDLLYNTQIFTKKTGSSFRLGCFNIEFIHVNHSIPDAVALAIRTPLGTIVHTGDFKIDVTPISGGMIDIARFGQLGNEGVLAMLSDSTNVEKPGHSDSERKVGQGFEKLFMGCDKRIIITTFASNVHRLQQIINVAAKYKRKVAITGRSMENVLRVASVLGYMDIPENVMVDLDKVNKLPRSQVVIISTGSQGEAMAGLTRMAYGEHRKLQIRPTDMVILSAHPIPGNEKPVARVINQLYRCGANVIYGQLGEVHVSGHACQEEIKLLHALVKPKYFLPIHGEYSKLWQHAELAEALGTRSENIVIPEIGQVIEMSQDSLAIVGEVPTGGVLVDGLGIGDVGNVVLRDRKHLSQDGLIIVVMAIDRDSGALVSGPDIISRGFVYVRENEDIIECSRELARNIVLSYGQVDGSEWQNMKNRIKDELHRYIFDKIKRNPMILPIIMEI